MNAWRYFQKYKKRLFVPTEHTEDVDQAIKDIFCEFIDETIAIGESRQIILWSHLFDILNEQNIKWNRVIKYATDRYGYSPLKRDCILNFCKDHCSPLQMAAKGVFQ